MASWNLPDVLSTILRDVPIIRTLLNALLKQDPEGTTDLPTGAKRWTDTADGKQFQVFNGSSWASVGKLNHDAASVDGFSASQTVQANAIAVRDKDGKLPGDILGNAATASKAAALSATNPISKGGTSGTTAAEARENLVVPPKNHASASTDYGLGTETEFGHVQSHDMPDVSLAGAGGHAFSPAGAAAMQDVLEGQISDLTSVVSGNAAAQAAKDAEQDEAITSASHKSVTDIAIDGLDLVLTYGDGSEERKELPAGKSVGDLWFGIDPESKPAGVQLYAGQLLSRAAYEAHSALVFGGARTVLTEEEWQAQVSANGFCPFYSSGDGSTTYRFPLIEGVHPKFVAAMAEAGQHVKAGAPNITGMIGDILNVQANASGAFAKQTAGTMQYGNIAGGGYNRFTFDASRSNSIYGASNTIQPEALTLVVGEWVVGSVATLGEADAESLLASVTMLESNVGALQNGVGRASAYIVETWRDGTSWYRKYSDGWLEQGGAVTVNGTKQPITFNIAFSNAQATILISKNYSSNISSSSNATHGFAHATGSTFYNQTETGFILAANNGPAYWYACGY